MSIEETVAETPAAEEIVAVVDETSAVEAAMKVAAALTMEDATEEHPEDEEFSEVEAAIEAVKGEKVDEPEPTPADVETKAAEPEPKVEEPEQKGTVDAKFDELLEKERDLRERETAVKDAESNGYSQEAMEQLAQTDPIAFLEKHGIKFDELVERIIDEDSVDPKTKALEDRIAKFESAANDRETQLKEAEMKVQLDNYVKELNTHIDGSEYEILKAMGAEGSKMVQDTLVNYWRDNKTEMDVDEACKLVDSWLENNEIPRIEKLLKASGKVSVEQETIPDKKQRRTLSNKASTTAPRRKAGPISGEDALQNAYRLAAELERNS